MLSRLSCGGWDDDAIWHVLRVPFFAAEADTKYDVTTTKDNLKDQLMLEILTVFSFQPLPRWLCSMRK